MCLVLRKGVANHAASADVGAAASDAARRAGLAQIVSVRVEAVHALGTLLSVAGVALQTVADA